MARNRGQRSAEERSALLVALEQSGLKVSEFARERGLSAWTLYAWRRQHRENLKADRKPTRDPAGFIEVRVAPKPRSIAPLSIDLENGRRVSVPHGFDAGELRRLLEVLATC